MKKILIVIAVAIVALATETQGQSRPIRGRSSQPVRDQMARPSNRGGDRGMRLRRDRDADDGDKLSSRDQRLIEEIESAESSKALRRYLQSAVSSRSEEVRMAMVNALERADKRSASDVAYFIADPSEAVAEAAFSAWTSILSDTRSDQRVRVILESAQIMQGQSNGHLQGQGHDAQGPHRATPGALPGYGAPMSRPGAGLVPAVE